jgi:hypothetical protein
LQLKQGQLEAAGLAELFFLPGQSDLYKMSELPFYQQGQEYLFYQAYQSPFTLRL